MLTFGSSWWLGQWGIDAFPALSGGEPWFYLAVFSAASAVAALAILLRAVLVCFASVRAARSIHEAALSAVLASPMSFFDTTPLGRVLNRFSADVQRVDVTLSGTAVAFIGCTLLPTT